MTTNLWVEQVFLYFKLIFCHLSWDIGIDTFRFASQCWTVDKRMNEPSCKSDDNIYKTMCVLSLTALFSRPEWLNLWRTHTTTTTTSTGTTINSSGNHRNTAKWVCSTSHQIIFGGPTSASTISKFSSSILIYPCIIILFFIRTPQSPLVYFYTLLYNSNDNNSNISCR